MGSVSLLKLNAPRFLQQSRGQTFPFFLSSLRKCFRPFFGDAFDEAPTHQNSRTHDAKGTPLHFYLGFDVFVAFALFPLRYFALWYSRVRGLFHSPLLDTLLSLCYLDVSVRLSLKSYPTPCRLISFTSCQPSGPAVHPPYGIQCLTTSAKTSKQKSETKKQGLCHPYGFHLPALILTYKRPKQTWMHSRR